MSALLVLLWTLGPIGIGLCSYRAGRRDEAQHWCRFACVRCKVRVGEELAKGDLPSDYEPCRECGFDHAYEPVEARLAHEDLS